MQNKEKLMSLSRENEFGDRSKMGTIWTELFFGCNNHQSQLFIIAVYHNMQNQRNPIIQSRENGRKPQIWAISGPFCLILDQEFFSLENWATSLFYVNNRLTWCKETKKSYDWFSGKTGNRRTNGRTDGRTDERGSIFRINLSKANIQDFLQVF